jgi:hypothetical protein
MKIHKLKVWPPYLNDLTSGRKTFEWRFNDRDYEIDDILIMMGWDPNEKLFIGEPWVCRITYLMKGPIFGIPNHFVIMSITKPILLEDTDDSEILQALQDYSKQTQELVDNSRLLKSIPYVPQTVS